jgi:hypothetical protein
MPTLDLSDEETDSLVRLLRDSIDRDRYPLSPRVKTWEAILDRLRPPPPSPPSPRDPFPVKNYEPPRHSPAQRRARRG